jgi:hypothetical protein
MSSSIVWGRNTSASGGIGLEANKSDMIKVFSHFYKGDSYVIQPTQI